MAIEYGVLPRAGRISAAGQVSLNPVGVLYIPRPLYQSWPKEKTHVRLGIDRVLGKLVIEPTTEGTLGAFPAPMPKHPREGIRINYVRQMRAWGLIDGQSHAYDAAWVNGRLVVNVPSLRETGDGRKEDTTNDTGT